MEKKAIFTYKMIKHTCVYNKKFLTLTYKILLKLVDKNQINTTKT